VDTPPDPLQQHTSPEPSKRNLIAWIWRKLGEPSPDDGSKPIFLHWTITRYFLEVALAKDAVFVWSEWRESAQPTCALVYLAAGR
jgi:hypothetical protein